MHEVIYPSIFQHMSFLYVVDYSPIGEVFRARLRQFPSLVNCCTIDWFSEWPDEALQSVASTFLQEITDLDEGTPLEGLVSFLPVCGFTRLIA